MKDAAALLIPGNMCDARMWRGGGDIIRQTLQERLGARPLDVDTFADDSIAAMACRALRSVDGPVLPIGFSMGAIVALEMAMQAPDRVKGLVLSAYNAGADLPERAKHRPAQQDAVRRGQLRRLLVEELKPVYLASANRDDHGLLALLLEMGLNAGAEVFVRQSEALRTRLCRIDGLAQLDIPVLFVAGSEDQLCPPEWHRRWASLTPRSSYVEIEKAGHMAPLEQPQLFAGAIGQWLASNTERLAA